MALSSQTQYCWLGRRPRIRLYLLKPNTADWEGDQEQGFIFSNPILLIGKETKNKALSSQTQYCWLWRRPRTRLDLLKPNTADWEGDQEQGFIFSNPILLIGKETKNKALSSQTQYCWLWRRPRTRLDLLKPNTADWEGDQEQGFIFSNPILLIGKETKNKALSSQTQYCWLGRRPRTRLYLLKPNTADWEGDQEQGFIFSNLISNDWEGDQEHGLIFLNPILLSVWKGINGIKDSITTLLLRVVKEDIFVRNYGSGASGHWEW